MKTLLAVAALATVACLGAGWDAVWPVNGELALKCGVAFGGGFAGALVGVVVVGKAKGA